MPVGIGNLTNIRALTKFIVGVEGGGRLNIRELKDLSQLKGELSIQGLHNVEDFQQAEEADLKGKKGLERLVMEWNRNLNEEVDSDVAAKVLELLQPHGDLKSLAIKFYNGREFPSWIGDPLLMSHMVELELCNCWNSTSLPSLGRLPLLKHLIIDGMVEVERVGFEFYNSDSAFMALETLKFENMRGWEWCLSEGEGAGRFPRLRSLAISNCLVAKGVLILPSLCELKLKGCNVSLLRCMTGITSLKTLSLERMSGLCCLDQKFGQALEYLEICSCEDLTSLWQSGTGIEEHFTRMRSLVVRRCPQLVSLFTASTIKKMVSLEKVHVEECPKIMSILIEQQEEEGNDEIGFPLKLRHVELVDCGDKFIQFMVNGLMMRLHDGANCVVDHLEIRSCDSIQHLEITSTRGGNKLKSLTISNSRNLVSLCNSEQGVSNVEIEELTMRNCPSLTIDGMKLVVAAAVQFIWIENCSQLESAAEESIMSSTSTLVADISIWGCPNLKRLPDSLHSLTNLTYLSLLECGGLECFPENGLPIPNLNSLYIVDCWNLKSLPKNMHCLTSLKTLEMCGCPGVKFFTEEEGGLPPPNLIHLTISYCSNLKQSMSEWGFHTLTSLQELSIEGVPQLPEDEPTLTTT